jgi:hypothetical protein
VDYASNTDLVIENDLPRAIYLVTTAEDGSITCAFAGASEDRPEKVEIVRSGAKSQDYEKVETKDPSLAKGTRAVKQEGRRGFSVSVYRVVKMPGKPETREYLSSDTYPARSEIARVNPISTESEAKAAEAAKKAAAAKGAASVSRPPTKPKTSSDSTRGAAKSPPPAAPERAGPEDV